MCLKLSTENVIWLWIGKGVLVMSTAPQPSYRLIVLKEMLTLNTVE